MRQIFASIVAVSVCAVALGASGLQGAEQFLPPNSGLSPIVPGSLQVPPSPMPMPMAEPLPATHSVLMPSAGTVYVTQSTPVELFQNVKYRQERNIHPCAVPKIVSVKNPCYDKCDPCSGPECVFVKICVPPCEGSETVCVTRNGKKVRYDYGAYAVNVTSVGHRIVVDYDD